MEFPEFALALRSKGCCRCLFGELVIAQGEILENDLYRFRILLEQLLKFRVYPGAIRSLEIAENSKNHRCIPGTFERRIRRVDLHKKIQGKYLNYFFRAAGDEKSIPLWVHFDLIYLIPHMEFILQNTVLIKHGNVSLICQHKYIFAVRRCHHIQRRIVHCQLVLKVHIHPGKKCGCRGKKQDCGE